MKTEPKTNPKNVKVLGQSCSQDTLFLTVIDLDNNEVVILCYASWAGKIKLIDVIRTESFVNPDEQPSFSGKDAPFEKE
jgi:hypothetical protein